MFGICRAIGTVPETERIRFDPEWKIVLWTVHNW